MESQEKRLTLLDLVREFCQRFPLSMAIISLFTVLLGLLESSALITLAPLVDYFAHPDLEKASPLTNHVISALKRVGLPYHVSALIVVFLLFNILRSWAAILAQYSIAKASFAVLRQLLIPTFKDFFDARLYFHTSHSVGVLLNTLLRETNLAALSVTAAANLLSNALQIILIACVPLYISWKVTAVCLGTAVVMAFPCWMLGRMARRLGQKNTDALNQITSELQQSLGSAKLILGFGNGPKNLAYLDKVFQGYRRSWIGSTVVSSAVPQLYYPLGLIVAVVGFLYTQYLGTPTSEVAVVLYALLRINGPMGLLVANKNNLNSYIPSYEQITRLTRKAKEMKQPTGDIRFKDFRNQIVFRNVSFAYPGRPASLSDINLRVPKGKMVAFVGASGAGKSTIVDLIMAFHEPTTGAVTIDDTPLHEFDIMSYRRKIGYVPQESVLFNASIADNLRWAKDDATDEEIEQACRQAHALDFIDEAPKRFETVVGDRGVRLSGGQVQRIALARAILRRPELLILDEATSSLDTMSERLIQEAVDEVAKETTVIIVAHRISTIKKADYIYVLEKGRIIEEGSYSQLMAANSEFARMAGLQDLSNQNSFTEAQELAVSSTVLRLSATMKVEHDENR